MPSKSDWYLSPPLSSVQSTVMGLALDQSCSGTFSACVAWVWHNECQTWQSIPNPHGTTQNLLVWPYCWRHHRAESQKAEELSWYSPANLMPTTYFIVLEGALHGTGITSHHQSWGTSELFDMCIIWYETAMSRTEEYDPYKPAIPFPWARIRKANLPLPKHKQVFTNDWNIKKKPQQQKTSNVSFLPLNVYTVILLPHRYLLLRPANSCPCAVHNKQDGILGCCSNRYVSIKICASKHAFLTDPRFLEYLCLSLI